MGNIDALKLWQRLATYAVGRWLFSRLVRFKAPYFNSVRPVFDVLEPGRGVARMKKRRAISNHIGTVHVIAIANLCEFVAGTATEISTPKSMRWIPRGMRIDYLGKAATDLSAEARLEEIRVGEPHDITVSVDVTDVHGEIVVHADIDMYVSPRKATIRS